ncbi:MAG: DUF5677 domain-containing protein [Candidatus Aenigmatarchaeota archaeon]
MNIENIRQDIAKSERDNIEKTKKRFSKHIGLIEKQHECLLEFLVNFSYENLKITINQNAYLIIFSLFADMIKKERLCIELIQKGYYSEAGSLLRTIFDHYSHILYLSKYPADWEKWIQYNNYQMDKVEGKNPQKPNNVFLKPTDQFLDLIGKKDYYRLYRKLSGYIHTSSDVLHGNFTPLPPSGQIYHYAPRFIEDKSEFLLNILFGFINESIWLGLNKTMEFSKVPESLEKYKETQEDVAKCFDKFYLT